MQKLFDCQKKALTALAFLCLPGNITTFVLLGTIEEEEEEWNSTFEDYESIESKELSGTINESHVEHHQRHSCHENKGNFVFF